MRCSSSALRLQASSNESYMVLNTVDTSVDSADIAAQQLLLRLFRSKNEIALFLTARERPLTPALRPTPQRLLHRSNSASPPPPS
jgi:hypothetical protein